MIRIECAHGARLTAGAVRRKGARFQLSVPAVSVKNVFWHKAPGGAAAAAGNWNLTFDLFARPMRKVAQWPRSNTGVAGVLIEEPGGLVGDTRIVLEFTANAAEEVTVALNLAKGCWGEWAKYEVVAGDAGRPGRKPDAFEPAVVETRKAATWKWTLGTKRDGWWERHEFIVADVEAGRTKRECFGCAQGVQVSEHEHDPDRPASWVVSSDHSQRHGVCTPQNKDYMHA